MIQLEKENQFKQKNPLIAKLLSGGNQTDKEFGDQGSIITFFKIMSCNS